MYAERFKVLQSKHCKKVSLQMENDPVQQWQKHEDEPNATHNFKNKFFQR
jgi:hypothetical protein